MAIRYTGVRYSGTFLRIQHLGYLREIYEQIIIYVYFDYGIK